MNAPLTLETMRQAIGQAALVRQARQHLRAGRFKEAASLLLAQANQPDETGVLRTALAEAYDGIGEKHRARLLWLDVARTVEGGGRHLWRLGCNAFERRDYEEAARFLGDYLAVAPGDLAAAERLLEARLAAAPLSDRHAIYDQHVEHWPKTSYVLAVLAIEVLRFESRAEALHALEWAQLRWEGALPAALRIADAYAQLGEPKRALTLLDRALAHHPASVALLRARLRGLQMDGAAKQDLLSAVDRLIAVDPDDPAHLVQRARLLANFRDWTGAAASYRRALELDPDVVAHWRGLVVALGNLEREAEIDAVLDRARAHFRDRGADGVVDLATLEIAAGQFSRAVALAGNVLSNPRVRNRARDIASTALLAEGQYVRAWSYLSTAIQDGQAGAEALRMAARCGAALRLPAPGRTMQSFPGALFERALLTPPPRPLIQPDDVVMLVTSSLGAGGAERQVALTASNVARQRAARGAGRTILVGQDLTPDRGRAVMRSIAATPELLIEDLELVDEAVAFRSIAASDPAAADALRLIAALPAKLSRNVLKLYDCFRRHRPSLVHLWQDGVISAGSVAAVLAGVPAIVASMRNVVASEADRRRYRPYLRTMYQALLQRPEACLTANSAAGAADYQRWLDLPAGAINVIRNGVETEIVRARAPASERRAARESLGVGEHDLLVGGTFRLAPAKRPHLWLTVAEQVARQIPQSRFVIVGDGVLRNELEGWIQARGLADRVTLAGRKSPVEPWIAAMDAMLLASEVEGLPNVLLEAQALGVPVVTTNAGGAGEAVLDEVTGFLVPSDDPGDLAGAVARLLNDHQMRGRARVGAPAFIEQRFGLQRMLADTLAVYARTLTKAERRT